MLLSGNQVQLFQSSIALFRHYSLKDGEEKTQIDGNWQGILLAHPKSMQLLLAPCPWCTIKSPGETGFSVAQEAIRWLLPLQTFTLKTRGARAKCTAPLYPFLILVSLVSIRQILHFERRESCAVASCILGDVNICGSSFQVRWETAFPLPFSS